MAAAVALDAILDPDHQPIAGAADPAARHRHLATAQDDLWIGGRVQRQRAADLEAEDVAEADRLLLEHRLELDPGEPDLARQMVLPDRIAAELLAHEHLQQQVAGGLQGGVGDQELDRAAAILEVDAQLKAMQPLPGRAIAAKRGLVSIRSKRNAIGVIGANAWPRSSRIRRTRRSTSDASIDGEWPPLDPHRRRAAAAAQQHIDNGIDHLAVDHDQAIIVPLHGLEDGDYRRG